jgi:Mg-chelatase subunit ChlD
MSIRDVQPQSPQICGAPGFSDHYLANRLGVVYEAMLTYILTRKAVSPADTITFIPFCGYANVVFSQLSVTEDAAAVGTMMRVLPDGGTDFGCAIQMTYNQLKADEQSAANQGRTPVFVLLTDSEDWSSHAQTLQTVESIMQQEVGTGLKLHCLGFGTQVNTAYMEQLAGVGNGAFYNNLGSNDLARCCSRFVSMTQFKNSMC